ncbi:MAG: hypothetical protein PVI11_00725 [Candidatus Aminicenantes bacterium]
MKKRVTLLAFLALCVSLSLAAENSEYYSYSYARLSYVKGDVFVQRADDLGYEEGVVNLPLVKGDKIGTREGRAEIHLGKKNYLRIDRQTQLDLVELPRRGYDKIQIHLLAGDIFLRVNFLEREKDFEIHTPDASFYILEEGLFRVIVRENIQTEVLVYEGILEAAGEEGSLVVEQDESVVAADGYFRPEMGNDYVDYDDSFADWSHSRDELYSRFVARHYLPAELDEYEVELAYNGRWVYEAPYGYVWVPHVSYSYWRPYYYGRWAWYPIIGWTWVSYDPWGWCVYRYGRWHWRATLGWYWIPNRIWGPAWVHWYHGPHYIGWCPLSYWNRPVVIINNHFYGRYNEPYYPAHSRALTVVHKNQLQARSVSKVALSQHRVRQISKMTLSSRQPNVRALVDRTSTKHLTAAKVLSRTNIRQVRKNYSAGKTSGVVSRVKATPFRNTTTSSKRLTTIKKNIGSTSRTREPSKSGLSSRAISPKRSSGAVSSRTIKRYSPSSQRSSSSRSSVTQKRAVTPSKRNSSSRSSVSKVRMSSSTQSTKSSDRAKPGVKKIVKFPSRSQNSKSASLKKKSTSSSKNKTLSRSKIRKFPPSSSSLSTRGRSYTAPTRSLTSRSSSVKRYPTPRRSSRSSVRSVRRPSSATRSISRSTPSRSSRSTVRSSSPSRRSVSRSSRSSVRSVRRPSSATRSISRSTPSRSSRSAVRSSSPSRRSVSRSSRSSRSSVSRSSSSKRVKKK